MNAMKLTNNLIQILLRNTMSYPTGQSGLKSRCNCLTRILRLVTKKNKNERSHSTTIKIKKLRLKPVHQESPTKLYSRIKIAVKMRVVQSRAKAFILLRIKFKVKEKGIGNVT